MGELPEAPGAWYLVSFTGHGMGFAFQLAGRLVELALDGAAAGSFGAGRFADRG